MLFRSAAKPAAPAAQVAATTAKTAATAAQKAAEEAKKAVEKIEKGLNKLNQAGEAVKIFKGQADDAKRGIGEPPEFIVENRVITITSHNVPLKAAEQHLKATQEYQGKVEEAVESVNQILIKAEEAYKDCWTNDAIADFIKNIEANKRDLEKRGSNAETKAKEAQKILQAAQIKAKKNAKYAADAANFKAGKEAKAATDAKAKAATKSDATKAAPKPKPKAKK